MISDLCEAIALLLVPAPASAALGNGVDAALDSVLETRESTADRLWDMWEGADEDPLLVAISEACMRRRQADQELRLLLAFGREFVRPRPYELTVLAEAGGLSASGAKTAYKRAHVAEVAAALGRTSRSSRRVSPSLQQPCGQRSVEEHPGPPAAVDGGQVHPYQRIADELREQIRSGTRPVGSRLPSVRELVASHSVAMATARHGLQQLIDEQLIYTVQGLGSFVAPDTTPSDGPDAAMPAGM